MAMNVVEMLCFELIKERNYHCYTSGRLFNITMGLSIKSSNKRWCLIIKSMNYESYLKRCDYLIMINAILKNKENKEVSWIRWNGNFNKVYKFITNGRPHMIELDKSCMNFDIDGLRLEGSISFFGKPSSLMPTVSESISYEDPVEFLSDVTFVCDDGEQVKGCKALLAVISPVFNAMFCNKFKNEDVIPVPDITSEAMGIIIQYSSTRSCNVNMDENLEFILLCNKYLVGDIVERWIQHSMLYMNCTNVLDIFKMSKILRNPGLYNATIAFMRKHKKSIKDIKEHLDKDDLYELLNF